MRALSIDYTQQRLREREVPEPVLTADNQVLFRVREVGVCGTDRELAAFRFGRGPSGSDFLIPGHEALGEVVRCGSSVTEFSPGDLVVPSVRRACHPACGSCAGHRRDLCTTGNYTERGILGAHGYFTELAADSAEDLVRVPPGLADLAVLVEPLSVVEKAVSRALEMHQGHPETALVLGAGAVGLLSAAVLRLRGLEADVVSREAVTSSRAALVRELGSRYLTKPDRAADIVIEAAGAPEAADTGLRALGPLGVMLVLGARETLQPLPLLELIVGNKVIAGSVNASPEACRAAVADLALLPRSVLARMIERAEFSHYSRAMLGPLSPAPKVVHVLG